MMMVGSHSLAHQWRLPSQIPIYPSYVKLSIDRDDHDEDDHDDDDDNDADGGRRYKTDANNIFVADTLPSVHRWHYHRGEKLKSGGFGVSSQTALMPSDQM